MFVQNVRVQPQAVVHPHAHHHHHGPPMDILPRPNMPITPAAAQAVQQVSIC